MVLNNLVGTLFQFTTDDLLPDYSIEHLASLFSPEVDAVVSSVETKYEVHSEYATSDDNYFRVKEEGTRSVSSHDLFGLHCLATAKLFRRSLIQELGLEFPRGIYYEDAFWHWCFMMNTRRVCFTKKVCYTYIRHPNSIMSLTYEKREGMAIHHLFVVEAIIAFLKKHCRNPLDPRDVDELLRIYFWLAYNNSPAFEQPRTVWECSRFLRSENYDCSRSSFLQSVKNGDFYPDAEKRIKEAAGKEKALLQEKIDSLGRDLSRSSNELASLKSETENLQQELSAVHSELETRNSELRRTREEAARFSREALAWKKKCLRPRYYRYVLLSKVTIGRRRVHYRNKVRTMREEFGFR